jgi:carboxypeptidase Taq
MSDSHASKVPVYEALHARHQRVHRYMHLASIANWDRSAFMPARGNDARAAALAEMAALIHSQRTDAAVADQLARAEQEPLSDMQRSNLVEMNRQYVAATALPDELVRATEMSTARCEHAWRTQRPANDWAGFLPNLDAVFVNVREQAKRLSDKFGVSPYDAMMDLYEPGMRVRDVKTVFDPMREWLPALIDRVVAKQATEKVIKPEGPFPEDRQRWLGEQVMRLLQFDFEAGRLDVSAHPFTGGVPEDVRMTTRYNPEDFLSGLMGTIHETGHGRYEQCRPREWLGQPVSEARSMGIHESQSLSFEMQLGSHPGFVRLLAPLVQEAFGKQAAFEPDNLLRLVTRVNRGLIRVDADEVTYPAHILLRFDLEQKLLDGGMKVADIPAAWDEGMRELLQMDTRGNFKDGPMQDIHWPAGLVGYFPSYTLGAMYAAQWFSTMRKAMPNVDASIAAGDLSGVFGWLHEHIWSQGSRWTTQELARRASGEPLNVAHFKSHLERRYLGA